MSLSPATFADQPWTLVTYAFAHVDVWHLLANLVLIALLYTKPPARFLTLAVAGVVVGGLFYLGLGQGAVVGASGAVFALYGAAVWERRWMAWSVPIVFGVHLLFPFAWPVHLGGFLAGLLIATKWK